MAAAKRKRRLLIGLGVFLATVGLILALLPFWLPAVLRPALNRFGVQYASYERQGYSRFHLRDVRYARGQVTFRAGRVEAYTPARWLWQRWIVRGAAMEPYVEVGDWTLTIGERQVPGAPRKEPASIPEAARRVESTLDRLRPWLREVTATNGLIQVAGREFRVPAAEWKSGRLAARVAAPEWDQEATLSAHLPEAFPWTLAAQIEPLGLRVDWELTAAADGFRVRGTNHWLGNVLPMSARWEPGRPLPAEAELRADALRVPAELAGLSDYEALTGSLRFRWRTNQFSLTAVARAQPLATATNLFPAEATLQAAGDLNVARIEELRITAPWLTLETTEGFAFTYQGRLRSPEAAINFHGDLSRQPWVPLAGLANGTIWLRPGEARWPDATFHLSGQDLRAAGLSAPGFEAHGFFRWPILELVSARLELADAARAQGTARLDLAAGIVERARVELAGHVSQPFVPVAYSNLSLTAEAHGRFQELIHAGRFELENLQSPGAAPLRLAADWRGAARNFDTVRAEVTAADAALAFAGAAAIGRDSVQVAGKELNLRRADQIQLALNQPFQFRYARPADATNALLSLEAFAWSGPAGALAIDAAVRWPRQGEIRLSARDASTEWFRDFVSLPRVRAEELELAGGWTNGPARFDLTGTLHAELPEAPFFSVQIAAHGGPEGLTLRGFRLDSESQPVVSGDAQLPITLNPAAPGPKLQVHRRQPLHVRARSEPNAAFWRELTERTGVAVVEPHLEMELDGTIAQPQGKVELRAAELRLPSPKANADIPPLLLTNLEAHIVLDQERIVLRQFRLRVEGQPVTAEGELPLAIHSERLRDIFRWEAATARVELQEARLAPFARFAPKILQPQGWLTAQVQLRPGLRWQGDLKLADAGTRPLTPLGPLQDLQAWVRLADRRLEIKRFAGLLGGAPLHAFGSVDFAAPRAANGLPRFEIGLGGVNVPLVRQPDLIVRADVELEASNLKTGQPVIAGTLRLRDSLFLSDLDDLLPGRVARPQRRPPYFSVTAEPFANWRLAVKVTGNEFMRVRSPLFRGLLSADFQLQGTLREPRALGRLSVDSGRVQFPFASLEVKQGLVSLTSANPFEPQLEVTAESRAFGYNVTLRVTGAAAAPLVEFTSTPPLTSEQVLLMLTAGEMPRQGLAFGPAQRFERLAVFLGRSLLVRFGVGDAAEERLVIRSGEDISEEGRPTYSVEYRLSENWSLVGEYDRFGEFNMGVKWKIYSR